MLLEVTLVEVKQMNFQLTDAAVEMLKGAVGPIVLNNYKLGSDYGYIPSSTDVDIHGSLVYQGVPSAPLAVNANIVKYSVYLDYDAGPFEFGEIGLFAYTANQPSPILFALGTGTQSVEKVPLSEPGANAIRADIYLSMVGDNYEMWLDLAESDNKFRIASVNSPDQLPPSHSAVPNTYIIDGASGSQASFLAYTSRTGLWSFDRYSRLTDQFTVISSTPLSVSIIYSEEAFQTLLSTYKGQKILEFVTGSVFSICRYIKDVVVSGNLLIVSFFTPLAISPSIGEQFVVQVRDLGAGTGDYIPYPEKNNWAGVATIVDRPSDQPPGQITEYNYKKIPVSQAARGSLVFLGHWDAATNRAWGTVDGESREYTLFDDGLMIDQSFSSDKVDANGKAFLVSVGGATSLDGYTDWLEGDVVIAFGTQWYRLRSSDLLTQHYQISLYQDQVQAQRPIYFQKIAENLQLFSGPHNNATCIEAPGISEVTFPLTVNGNPIGNVVFNMGEVEGSVSLDSSPITVEAGDTLSITSPSSLGSISGVSIVLTFNIVQPT